MLIDGVPYEQLEKQDSLREKSIGGLVEYLEKKLGAKFVYDARNMPAGRADLLEPFRLGALLKEKGILKHYSVARVFPDQPQLKSWFAICNDPTEHQTGGTSWQSDANALYAALAEGLERYIWLTQNDYFINPVKATEAEIAKRGPYIPLRDIAGFSDAERAQNKRRQLLPDSEFVWIQGLSLISGSYVYAPAQIVSGMWRVSNIPVHTSEQMIRQSNTIGLATWPTQAGARLAGALEALEREAYMITWLNQLTLPRIALQPLFEKNPSLAEIVKTCERYRLKVHAIRLVTDAPTHPVMTVLEDMSGHAPRFTVGLKAHRSLPQAIEKALGETLRAHRGYRLWIGEGNVWDTTLPTDKVGHRERLYYWGVPENADKLEFLVKGPEKEVEPKEWDADTEEQNLERVIRWCAAKGFECLSFPLTRSAKNPTPWHIEMIVIPVLQPTYLMDWHRTTGGNRWKDVPKELGYTPLEKPFIDTPHPFS